MIKRIANALLDVVIRVIGVVYDEADKLAKMPIDPTKDKVRKR